jgi:hypothetical protein
MAPRRELVPLTPDASSRKRRYVSQGYETSTISLRNYGFYTKQATLGHGSRRGSDISI